MSDGRAPPPVATGERAAILAAIRAALLAPTSPHVRHATDRNGDNASLLPHGGGTVEEQIGLFAQRATALRAGFHIVPSGDDAAILLRQIAAAEGWKRIAHHDHQLIGHVAAALHLQTMCVADGYDRTAMEQCDAGITACDALIAHTGSVMLTTRSAGGRALSVLPPHHVVIATIDQLLPDLPAAYRLLQESYGNDWPSFVTFITGPSRTGDIERILVLGAHGPRKLTIILIRLRFEPGERA